MEELATRLVEALVSVCAKIVALSLQQVGRQTFGTIAVVVSQRRTDGRHRNAKLDGGGHHTTPGILCLRDGTLEEGIQQQVVQPRVLLERVLDLAQECGADDAAAAPHQRDAAVIQIPAVGSCRRTHELIALGVRDDLGSIQRFLEILDHLLLLLARQLLDLGAFELFRGGDALVLDRREAARKHGFPDQGQRHTFVQRRNRRPFAGALLAGRVEDQVQRFVALFILVAENVAGDLDQVGVELALVPAREDLFHLGVGHAEPLRHHLVGLADHLHVAILDAVVDHLHEMAGAILANPVAAGFALIRVGRDRLEDLLHGTPGFLRAAGHDRGTQQRALFAARDAGADVEEALALTILGPPDRVREVRVAAIDDDVALLQVRDHLVDERVNGATGLDHQHHLAGALQVLDEGAHGLAADDVLALGATLDKIIDLARRAVETGNREPLAFGIQDEVLPHHRQPDYTNIRQLLLRLTLRCHFLSLSCAFCASLRQSS